MFLLIISTVFATFMAALMIFIRLKASKRPISVKRIILPPLFMSTGALIFLFPEFQLQWIKAIEAASLGAVLSFFLIRSSRFEIQGRNIFLIPSKSFIFILFGLLLVRIIFKLIIGSKISFGETSSMFYLLGFGMIFTWRTIMLFQYIQLKKQLSYLRA